MNKNSIKIKQVKRKKKMIKLKIFMSSNFKEFLFMREKQNVKFMLMEELTWILTKLNNFKICKLILIKKIKIHLQDLAIKISEWCKTHSLMMMDFKLTQINKDFKHLVLLIISISSLFKLKLLNKFECFIINI